MEQNVSLAGANPRAASHTRLRAVLDALNAFRICVFSSSGMTAHQRNPSNFAAAVTALFSEDHGGQPCRRT
jgi:hypothetical protein